MKHAIAMLLTAVCIATAPAQANPGGVEWPTAWRLAGEGQMRWFGLALYHARLWVAPETRLPGDAAPPPEAAYALELTYARDIPGQRLVDTSIEELARLGWSDPARLERWRRLLSSVFPDVRGGERIVGLRDPRLGALFFHQGQPSGRIDDAELAQAFFGIWLDPRTREPGLRARLLGLS